MFEIRKDRSSFLQQCVNILKLLEIKYGSYGGSSKTGEKAKSAIFNLKAQTEEVIAFLLAGPRRAAISGIQLKCWLFFGTIYLLPS